MDWATKMVLAVETNDSEAFSELLRKNASEIASRTSWAFCADPLHCACARGRAEMAAALLAAGARPAAPTEDGKGQTATAAHFAVLHERQVMRLQFALTWQRTELHGNWKV